MDFSNIYKNITFNSTKQMVEFVELSNKEIKNSQNFDIVICDVYVNGSYFDLTVPISLEYFEQKERLFYDEYVGHYSLYLGELKFNYDITKMFHKFNYDIDRLYSAQKYLRKFKTLVDLPKINKSEELIKYTFGVEYETSNGHLPQNFCYKHGLIPLRDGSIGANEYATIVMKGNVGLHLIKEQTRCLNRYTSTNSDCSTHIHFGKLNTEPDFIFLLYQVLYNLQDQFEVFLPKYTFHTGEYKSTGKDYCKKLLKFNSFIELYKYLDSTKTNFIDIYQPNGLDPDGKHKWQIPGRYHWVNFVNLLFYNNNKTVEFRFLQTTTNHNKIINWIYILNGVIMFCEKIYTGELNAKSLDLFDILYDVYKPNIADRLRDFLITLQTIKNLQEKSFDFCGSLRFFDDMLIRNNVLDEK